MLQRTPGTFLVSSGLRGPAPLNTALGRSRTVRTLLPVLLVPVFVACIYFVLGVRSRLVLGRTPLAQLQQDAFSAPLAYVREGHLSGPHAERLVSLVQARDVEALLREWKPLERGLLLAEREAGHRGRPLIMDYMLDYPQTLRELRRRAT